jgi:hypothetical protein
MPLFSWGNSSHALSVEARQKRCTHTREAYLTHPYFNICANLSLDWIFELFQTTFDFTARRAVHRQCGKASKIRCPRPFVGSRIDAELPAAPGGIARQLDAAGMKPGPA